MSDPEKTGAEDGYEYAVMPHGLIAVRRPDGSMRMLQPSDDPEAAVRAFIRQDQQQSDRGD